MAQPSLVSQLLRGWMMRHRSSLDPKDIESRMIEGGEMSPAFIFLVFISCAIATLGLLLNSAAVVIGAMLIAPLMGPINLLGYAIAKTDVRIIRTAGLSLGVGVIAALVTSYAIVSISPFIPPTDQILARTNPNFFDLLVAVFSGLVAGFAIIRQQGGTFAGVAIATALMPPLATSGYGWATGSWLIFSGAFLLFLTNMLAIAFSVTAVTLWYGLGKWTQGKELAWRGGIAFCILAVLSVPLVNTLNMSVSQTILSKQVEDTIRQSLGKTPGTRIEKLQVIPGSKEQGSQIVAVVLTRQFDPMLSKNLDNKLKQQFGEKTQLSLDQLVVNTNPNAVDNVISGELKKLELNQLSQSNIRSTIYQTVPAKIDQIAMDSNNKTALVMIDPESDSSLQTLLNSENELRHAIPDWKITIIPAWQQPPVIQFNKDSSTLLGKDQNELQALIWALKRWKIEKVFLSGYASLNENTRAEPARLLAEARAKAVGDWLSQAGIQIEAQAIYPSRNQLQIERDKGAEAFRSVYINLAPNGPTLR